MSDIKDDGFDRIVKEMRQLKGIEFGVLEDAGDYPDGQSVAEVAGYNEFGTSQNPPRPFMRVASDQGGQQMGQLLDHTVGLMIDGRTTARGVDDTMGRAWVKTVQSTIKNFDTPPNAPSTIAMKGRDDPLVDTGRFKDSIDYRRLK